MKTNKDKTYNVTPDGENPNPLPQFGFTLKQLVLSDPEILKSHQNIKEHAEHYTAAADLP